MNRKIEFTINGNGTGRTVIDGKDISHMVRGVAIHSSVGNITSVTLDLIGEVIVTAENPKVFIADPRGRTVDLDDVLGNKMT